MSEIVATVKMLQEVVKGTIPVAKAIGDSKGNTINTTYATKTELQTETSNRQAADETLQSNIETETTQRQAADQTLQNNINTANAAIETLDNNAVKKTGETNQIIAGDVQIQGDLTVNGTTYTTNTETLMVNDNLIVANAAGTNLNNLSGLAIRTNSTDAYGILYDPATSSVKLGLGSLSDDNEFTFDAGEGAPIAVRSQDTEWTDGHVVEWDATERKFIDSGIASDNIVTISGSQIISGAKTFSETIQGDISGTAGKVAHKLTITTGDTTVEYDGSSDQDVEIELGDANDPNAVHFTQQSLTTEQQSQARANIGAAAQSTANGGFAGGSGTSATTGAAIGSNAQATADGAVQLGAGTNSTQDTLQFRNFLLCDSNGKIPPARLENVAFVDTEQNWSAKQNFANGIIISESTTVKAPFSITTNNQYAFIEFVDSNSTHMGNIGVSTETNGYYGAYIQAGDNARIGIYTDGSNVYTNVPNPPDSANGNDIATTSWVRKNAGTQLTFDTDNFTVADNNVSLKPATQTTFGGIKIWLSGNALYISTEE